jgi:hypothetical protein
MSNQLDFTTLNELSADAAMELEFGMIPELQARVTFPRMYCQMDITKAVQETVGKGANAKKVISIEADLVLDEGTFQMLDESEAAMTKLASIVENGTKFQVVYFLPGGVANFKTSFGGIAAQIGAANASALLDALQGVRIKTEITNRADRDDKSKIYHGLGECALVEAS